MGTRFVIPALATALMGGTATAQPSPPSCVGDVVVQRNDTLSRLAERCGISEGRLLAANPNVDGSGDLVDGMRLKLSRGPGEGSSPARSVGSFLQRSGDALAGLAQGFGSSVDDVLDKNPDLRQRLRSLGDRLNLPGIDAGAMQVEASPQAGPVGTSVTVTGAGLPKDTAVVIGAGAPGRAYEVLDRARTGPDGGLRTVVRVPGWADAGKPLVFTVAEAGGDWNVRAKSFDVTPGAKL